VEICFTRSVTNVARPSFKSSDVMSCSLPPSRWFHLCTASTGPIILTADSGYGLLQRHFASSAASILVSTLETLFHSSSARSARGHRQSPRSLGPPPL
jgi:hypothetical protein